MSYPNKNKRNFFFELVQSGQIVFEEGTIRFLEGQLIFFPVKSFLKIREKLIEKLGKGDAEEFLKDVGKYQVKKALARYSKTIEIEKLNKIKIFEFGIKMLSLLALGDFEVNNYDEESHTLIMSSKNVPTALEYKLIYGKSEEPVDSYICGILEEALLRFFEVPVKCVEKSCVACGDDNCTFEISPIKK